MRGSVPARPVTPNSVTSKKVAFIQTKSRRDSRADLRCQNPCLTQPIEINGVSIGGSALTWMIGPPVVESSAQMAAVGHLLKEFGVKFIRSAVYRPARAGEPYRGLGVVGLKLLKAAAERFDLQVVCEALEAKDVPTVAEYADVIEITPKSVQHTALVVAASEQEKTVILHRSPMMTFDEFMGLLAILEKGRAKVIIADSGVVSFDGRVQRMLDISSLITLKRETEYPVMVDCSAAALDWSYVEKLAIAAIAAGADGIIAELVTPGVKSADDSENKKALMREELSSLMWRARALKSTLNAFQHGGALSQMSIAGTPRSEE